MIAADALKLGDVLPSRDLEDITHGYRASELHAVTGKLNERGLTLAFDDAGARVVALFGRSPR